MLCFILKNTAAKGKKKMRNLTQKLAKNWKFLLHTVGTVCQICYSEKQTKDLVQGLG